MADLKTLIQLIKHIEVILTRKQRSQMIGLLFIIVIGSFFELPGVSVMLPFLQAMLNPVELMNSRIASRLLVYKGATDTSTLLFFIGVIIILIYIVKNVYLSISTYLQALYSNKIKREMAILMLRSYMRRPYIFWVEHETGEIYRGGLKKILLVLVIFLLMDLS